MQGFKKECKILDFSVVSQRQKIKSQQTIFVGDVTHLYSEDPSCVRILHLEALKSMLDCLLQPSVRQRMTMLLVGGHNPTTTQIISKPIVHVA